MLRRSKALPALAGNDAGLRARGGGFGSVRSGASTALSTAPFT